CPSSRAASPRRPPPRSGGWSTGSNPIPTPRPSPRPSAAAAACSEGASTMRLGDRQRNADGTPREDPGDERAPAHRTDPYARLKHQVSEALMERLAARPSARDVADEELLDLARDTLADIMNQEAVPLTAEEKARLVDEISADVIGYGPITPLLEDPDVTEIMCNDTTGVWVERRGLLEETEISFADEAALRRVIDRRSEEHTSELQSRE